MKNYLSTLWKAFLGWSSASWKSGRSGKINVAVTWGLIAVVTVSVVGGLAIEFMPDEQLELRSQSKKAAVLCRDEKVWEEILDTGNTSDGFGVMDPLNQATLKHFRGQPEEQARFMGSDNYLEREAAAFKRMRGQQELTISSKITQGQCVEATHGDIVKIRRADLHDWKVARDSPSAERIWVTYQGQQYRTYAGEWQRATGHPVAEKDRAPLKVPHSSKQGGGNYSPALAVDESTQTRMDVRPIPNFAQGQPYSQVRETLLRDGWQPVISEGADKCMDDDSRCQGRPEMQSCSGTGLAMCRFEWQRGEHQLSICTAGEEEARFNNVCG